MGISDQMQASGLANITSNQQKGKNSGASNTALNTSDAAKIALSDEEGTGTSLIKKFMDGAGETKGFSATKFENKFLKDMEGEYGQLTGGDEDLGEDNASLSKDATSYSNDLQETSQKKLMDKKQKIIEQKSQDTVNDEPEETTKTAQTSSAVTQNIKKRLTKEKTIQQESMDADDGDDSVDETKTRGASAQQGASKASKEIKKNNKKAQAQKGNVSTQTGKKLAEKADVQANISTAYEDPSQAAKRKKNAKSSGQYAMAKGSKEAMAKQYKGTFASFIMSKSPGVAAKLANLEKNLKKQGYTQSQITKMQQEVKAELRGRMQAEVMDALKESVLLKGDVLSKFQGKASLNSLLNMMNGHEKLGGKDFGNFQGGLQSLVNEANMEARNDVRDMAKIKFAEVSAREAIGGKDRGDLSIKDINQIAQDTGGTLKFWAMKCFRGVKENMGLNTEFIKFPKKEGEIVEAHIEEEILHNGDMDQQKQDRRRKRQQQKQENEDEDKKNELYISRLRAIFMQQLMAGNSTRTKLKTFFEMRTLKNSMIATGVYSTALESILQEEAKEMAFNKNIELLAETLMERATLIELKGPSFSLVEKKMKSILINAKNIGQKITSDMFNALRDEANRQMFSQSKKELQDTEIALQARNSRGLQNKRKMLIKLLTRLKEESGIAEEIETNIIASSQTIMADT